MGCCDQSIGSPGGGNGLFPGDDDKYIRFSNDSLVVTDGASTVATMDLCKMKIPYEQYVRTGIILPPGSSNMNLQYCGLLGNNVTFLAIYATYDNSNNKVYATPYGRVIDSDPNEMYTEYFFSNQPQIVRYFAQMMVLTGTESKPVPEVRVNNPGKYPIKLDIIAATTSTNIEDSTSTVGEDFQIKGLYWTDILSDTISGDFVIYQNNVPVAYIDRDKIAGIEVNGRILSIDDTAIGQIDLEFVDDFNANQANSILTWAMKDPNNHILPGTPADLTAPVITYKDTFTTNIKIDENGTNSTTGSSIITKQDLIDAWIESVIDNRDGEIILDDNNLVIIDLETGNEINAITRVGKYDVTITVRDIAQNTTMDNFVINVSDTKAARQVVQPWVTSWQKGLTAQPTIYLQDYPGDAINKQDLIDLVLECIYDERDGQIPMNLNNVNVTILKDNIVKDWIDVEGQYYVQYAVVDSDKNESTLLWQDKTTQLTDTVGNVVSYLILDISTNQAPVVTWKQPEPYEIDLYEFNVNGIISKSQLYKYLVIDVEDDRTPSSDIFLIDSKIIKTHEFDGTDYIAITPVELFYIDEKGQYNYQVQHIDSDAKISTEQKTVTII